MGRPNLSMVFFLFVAVTGAILTYPNKVLRIIQYFYVVLVYGASTPALIYPLASLTLGLFGPADRAIAKLRSAFLFFSNALSD